MRGRRLQLGDGGPSNAESSAVISDAASAKLSDRLRSSCFAEPYRVSLAARAERKQNMVFLAIADDVRAR